jgi:uncharacterized membrane protein YeaQ/YmgE (transglycosylase-associated protein family)
MIGFLVFGLFVGFIARLILPGRQPIGFLMTMLLGAVASIIGGVVANALRSGTIWELNFIGAIVAIASAVVVLAIAERAGLTQGKRSRGDLRRA